MTIFEAKDHLKHGNGVILKINSWIYRAMIESDILEIYGKEIHFQEWKKVNFYIERIFSNEWELEREYMDFPTAMKNILNEKTVECEETGKKIRLNPKGNGEGNINFNFQEISSKKWFIFE